MDNLTHTLLGINLGQAGLAQRYGKGTTFYLALMSNITDLDFLWAKWFGGPDAFLSRRMLTHSLVGVPLLCLIFAFLFRLKYKHFTFKQLFGLGILATGLHVLYDLANSYGVVLFYPFSRMRLELAWLFIIDLAIWGILLFPFVLYYPLKKWVSLKKLALTSLLCLTTYTIFCGLARQISQGILLRQAQAEGLQPDFTYVFPEALGPHRFKGVLKMGSQYQMYQIPIFSGKAVLKDTFITQENNPAVISIRQTTRAQRLEWFFKAPVWNISDTQDLVTVFDIRFKSTVLASRRAPFKFQFNIKPPMQALEEK